MYLYLGIAQLDSDPISRYYFIDTNRHRVEAWLITQAHALVGDEAYQPYTDLTATCLTALEHMVTTQTHKKRLQYALQALTEHEGKGKIDRFRPGTELFL